MFNFVILKIKHLDEGDTYKGKKNKNILFNLALSQTFLLGKMDEKLIFSPKGFIFIFQSLLTYILNPVSYWTRSYLFLEFGVTVPHTFRIPLRSSEDIGAFFRSIKYASLFWIYGNVANLLPLEFLILSSLVTEVKCCFIKLHSRYILPISYHNQSDFQVYSKHLGYKFNFLSSILFICKNYTN